jgi:hypothetical protein
MTLLDTLAPDVRAHRPPCLQPTSVGSVVGAVEIAETVPAKLCI